MLSVELSCLYTCCRILLASRQGVIIFNFKSLPEGSRLLKFPPSLPSVACQVFFAIRPCQKLGLQVNSMGVPLILSIPLR